MAQTTMQTELSHWTLLDVNGLFRPPYHCAERYVRVHPLTHRLHSTRKKIAQPQLSSRVITGAGRYAYRKDDEPAHCVACRLPDDATAPSGIRVNGLKAFHGLWGSFTQKLLHSPSGINFKDLFLNRIEISRKPEAGIFLTLQHPCNTMVPVSLPEHRFLPSCRCEL